MWLKAGLCLHGAAPVEVSQYSLVRFNFSAHVNQNVLRAQVAVQVAFLVDSFEGAVYVPCWSAHLLFCQELIL